MLFYLGEILRVSLQLLILKDEDTEDHKRLVPRPVQLI